MNAYNKHKVFPKSVNMEMHQYYKPDTMEDGFVSRLEVIAAIGKRIDELMIDPKFRQDYGDYLYEFKKVILELPMYELRKYSIWKSCADMWECNHCGYVVNPWNSTPYCPNCGSFMKGRK